MKKNTEFDLELFWKKLKTILKQDGLTYVDLANGTGININTFRKQATCNLSMDFTELLKICDYINVPISVLTSNKEGIDPKDKGDPITNSDIQRQINSLQMQVAELNSRLQVAFSFMDFMKAAVSADITAKMQNNQNNDKL